MGDDKAAFWAGQAAFSGCSRASRFGRCTACGGLAGGGRPNLLPDCFHMSARSCLTRSLADFGADNLVCMAGRLLDSAPYQEHAAAIAADPAVQDALVGALLSYCLPSLSAASADAAAEGLSTATQELLVVLALLMKVLSLPVLEAAVAGHMRAPGAAATMRHAAGIVASVAALPTTLPPALQVVSKDAQVSMHMLAASLLADLSQHLMDLPPASEGSGSSSRSGFEVGSSSGAADAAATRRAVAWELVAAVPHIAASIQALVAGAAAGELTFLRDRASAVRMYCFALVTLPTELPSGPCSAAQLSAWAAAAEASLRLLPLLLQAHTAFQQLPAQEDARSAAGRLAAQIVHLVWSVNPNRLAPLAGGGGSTAEAAAAGELQGQLARAHLAVCRLTHWLAQRAAEGDAVAPPGSEWAPSAQAWYLLLLLCLAQILNWALVLERVAHRTRGPEG